MKFYDEMIKQIEKDGNLRMNWYLHAYTMGNRNNFYIYYALLMVQFSVPEALYQLCPTAQRYYKREPSK